MAEFLKVMKDAKRMCLKQDCESCQKLFSGKCLLSWFRDIEPKEIEEKVEQWAKFHPEKTKLDVLKKMFPKTNFNFDDFCFIKTFGAVKDCTECTKKYKDADCSEAIKEFLDAPYEEPEESNE